jgi:hypothetical protein
MGVGLAASAWAGTAPDRSDLLDVQNLMFADQLDGPVTFNRAFLFLGESSSLGRTLGRQWASGTIGNSASGGTFLHWVAFEPDQARRSSTGGSLRQRDELGLRIVIKGLEVVPLQVVPACRAQLSVEAPKGAVLFTDVDRGQWNVVCNGRQAITTPALTEQNLADLRSALGTKVWGAKKVTVKGKCTGANCAVVP